MRNRAIFNLLLLVRVIIRTLIGQALFPPFFGCTVDTISFILRRYSSKQDNRDGPLSGFSWNERELQVFLLSFPNRTFLDSYLWNHNIPCKWIHARDRVLPENRFRQRFSTPPT
jgi:hypothetical protein